MRRLTDVPLSVIVDDDIRKPLINRYVLFVGRRLIKQFRFRRIWDRIVQRWPKNLIQE